MGSFSTSNGERIQKSVIDRRIRTAKQNKIHQMIDEYGYIFCEECGVSSGTYLDCSHTNSVDWCQKNGCVELAWDVSNIRMLCRKHHEAHDRLYIGKK